MADDGAGSDITGVISDLSDVDGDQIEVDNVISQIPAEQRASVRALVEVRRARTARRLQRHKKPEEVAVGLTRDSKKK